MSMGVAFHYFQMGIDDIIAEKHAYEIPDKKVKYGPDFMM